MVADIIGANRPQVLYLVDSKNIVGEAQVQIPSILTTMECTIGPRCHLPVANVADKPITIPHFATVNIEILMLVLPLGAFVVVKLRVDPKAQSQFRTVDVNKQNPTHDLHLAGMSAMMLMIINRDLIMLVIMAMIQALNLAETMNNPSRTMHRLRV